MIYGAQIEALTITGHAIGGSSPPAVALRPMRDWQAICSIRAVCDRMALAMFNITQNTIHRFSFTEILLMVAINQMECKRKVALSRS